LIGTDVLAYLLRRLLLLPVVLFSITLIVVAMMQMLTPEQRARAFIENRQQLRQIDQIIKKHGLDQPFHVIYGNWLAQALRGNLGYSQVSDQPVLETIRQRFPATLELALFAMVPIVLVSVWLGTVAALTQGRGLDKVIRILATTGYNLPTFMTAFFLLATFYGGLRILPGIGNISNENSLLFITGQATRVTGLLTVDTLLSGQFDAFLDVISHMVLPILTLVINFGGGLILALRSSMLETLGSDFVRTARAKGLSLGVVYLKHARRPALLGVLTLAGATLSALLAGSVLTEVIFAYPGIGQWGAKAAARLDYAGVLGFALFTALLVMISNLLTDISYALVDPRIRFD
jgi:ABC-type dipeptide/oligopeptide/nickel transport system permease component